MSSGGAWAARLRGIGSLVRRSSAAGRAAGREARFRLLYERFREILNCNDAVLGLIADVEDRLARPGPFALGALERRIRAATMDVFVMVKDLNLISSNRYGALYETLRRLDGVIGEELRTEKSWVPGPLVVPLGELRAADARLAGSKMANLGDVAASCGLNVPGGFVITTVAAARFLTLGQLWERCERLESVLEQDGEAGLKAAVSEIRRAIDACPLPEDLDAAMEAAFAQHFPERDARIAVRSSAIGEDSVAASHAGVYATELSVPATRFAEAYRAVLASAFGATAVAYRFERGLALGDSLMAVGCLRMVDARCAGTMYSRSPDSQGGDRVVVSVVEGLAEGMVAGREPAETLAVTPGCEADARSTVLREDEIVRLVAAARRIERHFGAPQDVEWAIDAAGALFILQARPLGLLGEAASATGPGAQMALLAGGFTACPGVDSGPVVHVAGPAALEEFPAGGVLVARHSTPEMAAAMGRAAAIVTEVGAPTGHMASLAREFGVPAIVNLDGALAVLAPGRVVTVDATSRRVLDGRARPRMRMPGVREAFALSPAAVRLQRVASVLAPLNLTDPTGAEFTPEHCRSLHDVTRYVHEKVFEVMFNYGDLAQPHDHHSRRLEARLPITVLVFDVGGGVAAGGRRRGGVRPEEIASVPMRAFLDGLLEPGIRWDLPRPVSLTGFLSVLGESMAGPPAEVRQIGRLSYAIVSDRYMNFSTKAGYHFSTVDTYCGESLNKNYVHFRFSGGAADTDRRERRVRFLSAVLGALDFAVVSRGDVLDARLDKYDDDALRERLVALGHLTMCARQLDMLMDSEASPRFFADAFLAEEWGKF